jgi:hypothetical protein
VYRGGYNCRHAAIPFKLTKSQREKLGLEQTKAETKVETKIEQQIVEVQKDIKNTIQLNEKTNNRKINDSLFLSTQSEKINNELNDVISFADGGIEIINEQKTNVSLRTPSQSTLSGGIKMKRDKGVNNYRNIAKMRESANGNCATNNAYMNIKIKKDEFIEFSNIDMRIDQTVVDNFIAKGHFIGRLDGMDVLADQKRAVTAYKTKDGWKYWSVSNANDKRVNIAPTITHETAHLIQNAKDNGDRIIQKLFADMKLKLTDAPTQYGAHNNHEFWTESFTYYVYDNKNLKKEFPKIFEFVENYLAEMKIDLSTIKIAK